VKEGHRPENAKSSRRPLSAGGRDGVQNPGHEAQEFLDMAGAMIIIINTDGAVSFVNRKVCEVFGYRKEQMVGKDWFHNFLPENCREQARSGIAALMKEKEPSSRFMRNAVLTKEGKERLIEWHSTVLTDETGTVVGTLISAQDVNAVRFPGDDLMDSHERLIAVLESLDAAVYVADIKNYEVLYANKFLHDRFGDPTGKICWQVFHRDLDGPCHFCSNPKLLTREGNPAGVVVWEHYNPVMDRWFELHDRAIRWVDGRIVRMGIGTDISRRKEAEEELTRHRGNLEQLVQDRTAELAAAVQQLRREVAERRDVESLLMKSEKKFKGLVQEFHSVLDAIPEALLLIDRDMKVRWANRAAAVLAGKEGDDLVGEYCFSLLEETSAPCDKCHALESFQTGESRGTQFSTPDGRFWDVSTLPIKNDRGRIERAILTYKDITENLTLQAEAMRAGHLASLGELAAGVAHEINNPVNGIINYAQILIDDPRDESAVRGISGRIMKEGNRIARIVKNLLSFARDNEEQKHALSIIAVLADSLALTETIIRKNGIHLRVDCPDDLPEIIGHGQQIQQVFLNVINNARYALNKKHSGSDPEKCFDITGEAIIVNGSPIVRLTFRDQGTGIPADIVDKIFHPFFSTKPGGEGTGLGLSISHSIISNHDGMMHIESVEGEYTKVIIDLPARSGQYG
jgi:PAS domain S-box-containing protein